MEEILASIRRIIADDQVLPLAARVPAPAAQPPAVQSPVRLTPSSIGRIRPEEAVSLDPAPMATLAPGPVARTVLRDDIAPPLDAGGSSAAEVAAPSRPLSEGSVSAADIARRVAITEIEPSTLRPRVAAEPTALRSDEAYRHALSEVRRRQDPS